MKAIAFLIAPAIIVCLASRTEAADSIRIWKIGSPHRGDTPTASPPAALKREAAALGFDVTVEAFPAMGFADIFHDAVARNAAPDVLSFDNFGVMTGITTPLGTFAGIGRQSEVQRDYVRVTSAFDELLGPERGWNYLVPSSQNHQAARTLALKAPRCPPREGRALRGELAGIVPRLAVAYLEGNALGLQNAFDPERLVTTRTKVEPTRAGSVQPCGWWGNGRLAFAQVNASYEAESAIGQSLVLLVLRRPSSTWQLLAATRDPVSNGRFWEQAATFARQLTNEGNAFAPPVAAVPLSPEDGRAPRPSNGKRFGTFAWQSSASGDVVFEIVEFASEDDARLFFDRRPTPESRRQISAGELWTTNSMWHWRVWSVTRAGDLALSSGRTFPH